MSASPIGSLPNVGAPLESRSRFVGSGFAAAARRYDGLVCVFSFGLDGWWRRKCLERSELRPGQTLLDVATGTGELAILARRALGDGGVAVGLDSCAEVLGEARRKRARGGDAAVVWIQSPAEALPFKPETFDRVTVGFALRHFDLGDTLQEIARVLKPGGRLVALEWTRPEGPFARWLFLGHMRRVVPPLVRLISRDPQVADLARYLPHSIERFMSGEALSRSMAAAGLAPAGRREYLLGLVSICVGVKGHPRGRFQGDPDESVKGFLRTWQARPRQKWWVILAGGVVLAIVAFQMVLALLDALSR